MAEDEVIDFDEAKRPHVFRRKEDKVKAIKQAFTAARKEAAQTAKPKPKRKRKNKGKRRK
ncbi:MAG: hypothetical protein KDI19_06530 [Pseudomonadales bacterium]|nr:hypothetical protein [Pseudomonadales bacterium]